MSESLIRTRVFDAVKSGKIDSIARILMVFPASDYVAARQALLDLVDIGLVKRTERGGFRVAEGLDVLPAALVDDEPPAADPPTQATAEPSPVEQPQKRKRGRPRKVRPVEETAAAPTMTGDPLEDVGAEDTARCLVTPIDPEEAEADEEPELETSDAPEPEPASQDSAPKEPSIEGDLLLARMKPGILYLVETLRDALKPTQGVREIVEKLVRGGRLERMSVPVIGKPGVVKPAGGAETTDVDELFERWPIPGLKPADLFEHDLVTVLRPLSDGARLDFDALITEVLRDPECRRRPRILRAVIEQAVGRGDIDTRKDGRRTLYCITPGPVLDALRLLDVYGEDRIRPLPPLATEVEEDDVHDADPGVMQSITPSRGAPDAPPALVARLFGDLAEVRDSIVLKLGADRLAFEDLVTRLPDEPERGVARAVAAMIVDRTLRHEAGGMLALTNPPAARLSAPAAVAIAETGVAPPAPRASSETPRDDARRPRPPAARRGVDRDRIREQLRSALNEHGTNHVDYLARTIPGATVDLVTELADELEEEGAVSKFGHGFYGRAAVATQRRPVQAEEFSTEDRRLSVDLAAVVALIRHEALTAIEIGRKLGFPRARGETLAREAVELGFAVRTRGISSRQRLVHVDKVAGWEVADLEDGADRLIRGSLMQGRTYLKADIIETLGLAKDDLAKAIEPLVAEGLVEIVKHSDWRQSIEAVRVLQPLSPDKPAYQEPPVATVGRMFGRQRPEILDILYCEGPQTTRALMHRLMPADPYWTLEHLTMRLAWARSLYVTPTNGGDLILGPFALTPEMHRIGEAFGQPKTLVRANDDKVSLTQQDVEDVALGLASRMTEGRAYCRTYLTNCAVIDKAIKRLVKAGVIEVKHFTASKDALLVCKKTLREKLGPQAKAYAPVTIASVCEKWAATIIPVILKKGSVLATEIPNIPELKSTVWNTTAPAKSIAKLAERGVLETKSDGRYVLSEDTTSLVEFIRRHGADDGIPAMPVPKPEAVDDLPADGDNDELDEIETRLMATMRSGASYMAHEVILAALQEPEEPLAQYQERVIRLVKRGMLVMTDLLGSRNGYALTKRNALAEDGLTREAPRLTLEAVFGNRRSQVLRCFAMREPQNPDDVADALASKHPNRWDDAGTFDEIRRMVQTDQLALARPAHSGGRGSAALYTLTQKTARIVELIIELEQNNAATKTR